MSPLMFDVWFHPSSDIWLPGQTHGCLLTDSGPFLCFRSRPLFDMSSIPHSTHQHGALILKLPNWRHICRCAREPLNQSNSGLRKWWGWDGGRELRRYRSQTFLPSFDFGLVTPALFLSPQPSRPPWLGNSLVFLSHSICLVSFLCMFNVFSSPATNTHLQKTAVWAGALFLKKAARICCLQYISAPPPRFLVILW